MKPRQGLDAEDQKTIKDKQRPRSPVVYEIIRREGEEELERPFRSLWWSGIAAGLVISASVFAEGLLHMHLPDTPWRPLIENFGYCIGFLLVMLSGFQLFTEQTVKAILPLLSNQNWYSLKRTASLWSIVFLANMVGTLGAAAFATLSSAISPEQLNAFLEISRHFTDKDFSEMLVQGIPAGFVIAVLVWMMPNAEGSKVWVIVLVTYLIALGELAHVVAGSAEVFLVLLAGEITAITAIFEKILPALIGNIIGGAALFSLIAYAQVSEEI